MGDPGPLLYGAAPAVFGFNRVHEVRSGIFWRGLAGARRVALLLDGFQDDGHDEAEAAVLDTCFSGFATLKTGSGITQGGFHLFQLGGIGLEEGEISNVSETPDQQAD